MTVAQSWSLGNHTGQVHLAFKKCQQNQTRLPADIYLFKANNRSTKKSVK